MSKWHIPDESIVAYSRNPDEIDAVTAASIEQHLPACARCQASVARFFTRSDLDAIWAEVEDRVDREGVGFTRHLRRRLSADSGSSRLLAATPALRVGTVVAVGLIVAAVVAVSRAADVAAAFLVLAPVVPTALVGLSFAPGADPAGESGLATPVFGFGLVVRRALAIEMLALLVLGVGSFFVPIDGFRALSWLLPALALSLGTLAASARMPAPQAATGTTLGWLALLFVVYLADGRQDLIESAVFGPFGQLTLGFVAVVACVAAFTSRQVLLQEVT